MAGSRRDNGAGTFSRTEGGWRCRTLTREFGKVGGTGPTKPLARAAMKARLQRLIDEGGGSFGPSFTTYARRYKARRGIVGTTADTEDSWIAELSRDPLGSLPILSATETDLKEWRLRHQKWASATIRGRARWLNQMLADAGSKERCPIPQKEQHLRRPLMPEEREGLRKIELPLDLWLATELCRSCLLRRSEACALRHEDAMDGGFWVKRAAVLVRGHVYVKDKTKTSRSYRWVPIPKSLRPFIGSGEGFVLGGREPMNPKSLSERLKRAWKGSKAESVPHMGTHALRRTGCMMLMESGADVVTAAGVAGHDPRMLLDEYTRTRRDLMVEAVERAFA